MTSTSYDFRPTRNRKCGRMIFESDKLFLIFHMASSPLMILIAPPLSTACIVARMSRQKSIKFLMNQAAAFAASSSMAG